MSDKKITDGNQAAIETGGYVPRIVSLLKETYRVKSTVYSGTTEECRDMADRLFHRGRPDE